MDLSMAYNIKMFEISAGVNNLANTAYFTRRAVGYPGPGIIPSDGLALYLTLGAKF
jgi:Fe(3+) dicitrate transport protein